MIIVHHLERSRSHRILWMLEELGLPYEVRRYARNPETLLAPDELKAIHPLGKSPVITDGAVTIAESAAILEYLLDRQDDHSLRPEHDTPAYQRYRYWLHYAEGSLMPILLVKLIFDRLAKSPMPFFVKPIVRGLVKKVHQAYSRPNLKRHLDFIESELGEGNWLLGDQLTAADIQMSYPLKAALGRTDLTAYPRIRSYLERVDQRPAYQRALEQGGPVGLDD